MKIFLVIFTVVLSQCILVKSETNAIDNALESINKAIKQFNEFSLKDVLVEKYNEIISTLTEKLKSLDITLNKDLPLSLSVPQSSQKVSLPEELTNVKVPTGRSRIARPLEVPEIPPQFIKQFPGLGPESRIRTNFENPLGPDSKIRKNFENPFGPESKIRTNLENPFGPESKIRTSLENPFGPESKIRTNLENQFGPESRIRTNFPKDFRPVGIPGPQFDDVQKMIDSNHRKFSSRF